MAGGEVCSLTFKAWAKGLLAAAIGGAANAVTLVIVDPLSFNGTPEGLHRLAYVTVVSGVLAGAMYLKKSPVPE